MRNLLAAVPFAVLASTAPAVAIDMCGSGPRVNCIVDVPPDHVHSCRLHLPSVLLASSFEKVGAWLIRCDMRCRNETSVTSQAFQD